MRIAAKAANSALDNFVHFQQLRLILLDRKSTRLNSSHLVISYAVFCLKKKKNIHYYHLRRTRLRIVETDEELSRIAGHAEFRQQRLSLADCYALGLAKRVSATVLTTDS